MVTKRTFPLWKQRSEFASAQIAATWTIAACANFDMVVTGHLAQLPDSTRAHCEAKGRLYNLTKDIISAGQALHAADPEAAAKYNSKLLYRRPGRGKTEAETTGTTAMTTTTTTTEKK